MSTVNVPVLVTIGLFLVMSFVVGGWSTKKASKGFISFMIADKSLPGWMVFAATFATYAGTITYMAWVGSSAAQGLSAGFAYFAHASGFMMMGLFLVPILIRMKRVTFAEPIGERYAGSMRSIASFYSLFALVGNNATQILGIGLLIDQFSGIGKVPACVIAAAILVTYVILGGMYGAASSGAFQGFIMIAFILIAPIAVFTSIGEGSFTGGISTVLNGGPESSRIMGSANWTQTIGLMVVMTFTNFMRPELSGTIFSARSTKEGTKAWMAAASLTVACMAIIMLLGMAARYAVPEAPAAVDQYGPALFNAVTPGPMTIFYIICIMSAAASTASAQMMGISRHYVTDFHMRIFYKNKQPDQKRIMLVSRLSIVVASAICIIIALSVSGMLIIFNFIFTVLVCGLIMPYVGMFLWPRMTTAACKACSITGVITSLVWNFGVANITALPEAVRTFHPALVALPLTILVAVAISLSGKPEYEKVASFSKAYNLKRMAAWAEKGLAGVASPKY